MHERQQRNMVQRLDGRLVNAGGKRGMPTVCATGCCCGHSSAASRAVPTDLYHDEWERRKLRNKVHLNQGGCLGPCPLANVVHGAARRPAILVPFAERRSAGRGAVRLHRDAACRRRHVAPPPLLAPHLFNGFAWDAEGNREQGTGNSGHKRRADARQETGDAIVVLTQADTDLLVLEAGAGAAAAGVRAVARGPRRAAGR